MLRTVTLASIVSLFFVLPTAIAQDRVDHYKGEPSPTLEVAMKNYVEYNQRLQAVLAKEELTTEDMVLVHELTYTLENALERIQAELEVIAETLEEVHVASETMDFETVKTSGARYLKHAKVLRKDL
ncbi:DUF6746 family protein [Aliidiomarina haloalkalitolerans]|uniref:Uncharacterized protein n=1 Tax=Aliidiomarina haloalkalitolerans TaxID=859059 RepID=A0A432VUM1_9GAMM|nr:DUF6746 family protein [Aliidiomarina haloalkalitolerans]RUO20223.1 hypothetical protein CWE06_06245 [Aliidiomarina haloalkalitolerans]